MSDGPWSILGNREQIAREAQALRVFASPPVQKALGELERIYAKDPVFNMPMAPETLKAAAAAMAMSGSIGAVNKDVDRPVVMWGTNAARRWHGLDVPRAGIILDNPDNVYRSVPIDGAASYVIRGRVHPPAPAQQTFVLYSKLPGTDREGVKEHLEEAGSVWLERVPLAADGSFTVTVDNSPADGRNNHLQTDPAARAGHILIRDTLSDWFHQNPVELSIERTGGPPVRPAASDEEIAEAAAAQIVTTGSYWLAWEHRVFFSRPVNTYCLNFIRGAGWGSTKAGHFLLADDEALVTTVERRGANYFSIQAADPWGPAVNYVDRNGSLNQTQAVADDEAGNAYTFVIGPRDPGVWNWLDTEGLPAGAFQVRWQQLPEGFTDEGSVRTLKVVKLADLKRELPAGTRWVTPEERQAQWAERAKSYRRRLEV
jgi:hypothetical protein